MLEFVLVMIAVGILGLGILHPPAAGPIKAGLVVVGFLFGMWRLFTGT